MTTSASTSSTRTIDLAHGLSLTINEYGTDSEGTCALLLHGGAGPRTMTGLATALSEHAYAIAPTHPGFDGTPRPRWADTIADLAEVYLDLLDTLGLREVAVMGNSIGGWIAAEMALRDTKGRIGSLVLLNAVGIHAVRKENEVVDARVLAPDELSKLSFANPALRPDFRSFSAEQRAQMAANQQALATYAGEAFTHDPKLRGRLHRVSVPVLVVWGEEDGIAPLTYGRGYAAAFPEGRFLPVPGAGHFPHIEQPERVLDAIGDFAGIGAKPSAAV
ncbi:alpha/beta fold hydrolase [Streptomyces sp. 8L]|uniref:alpha/beta fold hydrolase n=1 Tax=Streptomyces sp. 8L TaxID=2877242 RepID=UPI001CD58AB4|nr:alpha/beta hydrolase [Streptomyces sp. 8L]MCA1217506.1 alpha/beta hydrolase [Streptomyces sp. 8L]